MRPLLTAALLAAAPALALAQTGEPSLHADHPPATAPARLVEATGQIKSVDAKAGAVSIHHGPIAALGWPAMTMTFKASPEALAAARPGQAVAFTLQTPDNTVVAIRRR